MSSKPVAALVMVAETLAAGYLSLMTGLMSAWMVDDSQAFRMRDIDWVVEGCRRLAVVLVVSAIFTLVARFAHRQWVLVSSSPTWLRSVPLLLGGCIALAGAAGATWFVISRPFM